MLEYVDLSRLWRRADIALKEALRTSAPASVLILLMMTVLSAALPSVHTAVAA